MKDKNIIISVFLVLVIVFLGYNLNRVSNKYKALVVENNKDLETVSKLTEENRELLSKVSNSDESDSLKLVSENFLKGIYEYDEKTNRRENIKECVTNEFYNNYNLTSTETDIKYKSTYDKSEIYITDIKEGKVLVRVWNTFEISGSKTTIQTLLILNIVKEGEKYLVNNMEIQGTMNEKGFLN